MKYVFRNKETGEYKDAPEGFDINNVSNLSSEAVCDIEKYEILCINKILIPQIKLVLKPKEERVVCKSIITQTEAPVEQPKKRRRHRG